MLKNPEAFSRKTEAERTRVLRRMTFAQSAFLVKEILRFGSGFLKDPGDDRPMSYRRLLRKGRR